MSGPHVQFGCGLSVTPGWRNFDSSLTLRILRVCPPLKPILVQRGFPNFPDAAEYGDIIKGLPFAPASVRGIYCSHVLEHLSLGELRVALRNSFTCLQPGGLFRIVLPDLEYMIANYLSDPSDEAALRFIQATGMGETIIPHGLNDLMRAALGRSRHRWLWDFRSLARELKDAGFTGIRRAQRGDSPDPEFRHIEHPDRWENHLGLECQRPLVSALDTQAAAILQQAASKL